MAQSLRIGLAGVLFLLGCNPEIAGLQQGHPSRHAGHRPRLPDAGTASLVDAGATSLVDAGAASLVDAGDASLVDAGAASLVDAGDASLASQLPCALTDNVYQGCPDALPQPGSSCDASQAGKACAYPSSTKPQGLQLAVCKLDSQGAPFWSQMEYDCSRPCPEVSTDVTALDQAGCAMRSMRACPAAGYIEQDRLDALVQQLVFRCASGEIEWSLQITFAGGCAQQLAFSRSLRPEVAQCLKQELEAARYDCATDLSCGVGEFSSIF